jgi:DNA-binding transcriptional ArsR family regulator
VAARLGTSTDHERLALEHIPRPARDWGRNTPPVTWRWRQRASTVLTRDFFDREYVHAGKTLRDLEAETGFPRKFLAASARDHGISVTSAFQPAPIDADWLREQYLSRRRSYSDIAAELGVRTEIAAARRYNIPSRPAEVHSRPEMITTLSTDIPRAVEGGLNGWHRLRRFQTAMTFPTIEAAATHLHTHQSALIQQFQRLERDIGAKLYQPSARGMPMRPTRRGTAPLTALARPEIQALAAGHAPDVTGPATPGSAAAAAQQAAPLFRVLAEPTRLAILLTLQDGERRITDLAAELGTSRVAISSRMTSLKDRGLITGRPQGRAVYYRLARPELVPLLETAGQLIGGTGHQVQLHRHPAAVAGLCSPAMPGADPSGRQRSGAALPQRRLQKPRAGSRPRSAPWRHPIVAPESVKHARRLNTSRARAPSSSRSPPGLLKRHELSRRSLAGGCAGGRPMMMTSVAGQVRTVRHVLSEASGTPAGDHLVRLYQRDHGASPEALAHLADLIEDAGGRGWAQAEADRRIDSALACHGLGATELALAEAGATVYCGGWFRGRSQDRSTRAEIQQIQVSDSLSRHPQLALTEIRRAPRTLGWPGRRSKGAYP